VTLSRDDIRRVLLAHYTRPAGDPLAGRRIVVGAYLVPHPDGLLLLGQAFEFASDWARAAFAWSLASDGVEAPLHGDPAWVGRLRALDPCRVLLAHDLASVEAAGQAG